MEKTITKTSVNGSTVTETKPAKASAADGLIIFGVLVAFGAAIPLFGLWFALFGLGLALAVAGVVRAIGERAESGHVDLAVVCAVVLIVLVVLLLLQGRQ